MTRDTVNRKSDTEIDGKKWSQLHITNAGAASETSICDVNSTCRRVMPTKGNRRKKHGLFRLTLHLGFNNERDYDVIARRLLSSVFRDLVLVVEDVTG